jgi:hypothetical protein
MNTPRVCSIFVLICVTRSAMPEPFHILSLSVGGYLGLYTISVLAGIEEAAGHPLARHFELLAAHPLVASLLLAWPLKFSSRRLSQHSSATAQRQRRPTLGY